MLSHYAVSYGRNSRPGLPSGLPHSPQLILYQDHAALTFYPAFSKVLFLPIFDTHSQLPQNKPVKTSSAERTRLLYWMMRMPSFTAMPHWQQQNAYVP
jgi:hypothetical protein